MVKLGDIAVIKTGKLDSNAAEECGCYPFFTCSPETLRINTYAFNQEAILLAGNNAEGNYTAKYYKGKFNAYQRTYVIYSNNVIQYNNRFICYSINLALSLLKNVSQGTSTKFLTKSILCDLDIPEFTFKDQNTIVSIIGSIDDQIKCLSSINDNLLSLLSLEFEQLLDKVEESSQLGNIADIQTGPFGSQLHQEDYITGGTPLVSVENLGEFHLNRKHLPGISAEDCVRLSRYLMNEGDIIFSRVGYVDKSSYVSKIENGWMFSGSCLRIRTNDPTYALYTYLFLNTNQSKETFKSIAVGATRPSINSSILSEFEIALPSKSAILQFNKLAKKIESDMTTNVMEIEKLTAMRDYLLPKLMSGEIDVSTLEIPN